LARSFSGYDRPLFEHLRCQIDPDQFALGADAIDQAAEIQAGATADLYNRIASLQLERSNGFFAVREFSKAKEIIRYALAVKSYPLARFA
jgi:hypothetical protein